MSNTILSQGRFESIIDLYFYDELSLDEKKNILIQKNIFVKDHGVIDNESEIFYFMTTLTFYYNGIGYVINDNVCKEFYNKLLNYIDKKGEEYKNIIVKDINEKLKNLEPSQKLDILNSIKDKILDLSENENIITKYSHKLYFEEEVIKNFGDELFIYLTKGLKVITDEIDNYFSLKYGDEFLEGELQLNEDEYLEFLFDNYLSMDHLNYDCQDIEYVNYKNDYWKEFIDDTEFTKSFTVSKEAFYQAKKNEFCQYLINKYIDLNKEFFGHTIMAYDKAPKEFDIIIKWLKIREIELINSSFENILNNQYKSPFNIFTEKGEELFNKILDEFGVVLEGKAVPRKFQPICDAVFKTHEDYRSQIFKVNFTKKEYIQFLNYKYEAKITDLTRLSDGEVHQLKVNQLVKNLMEK